MRVVILHLFLPFLSLQLPREEILNMFDNSTRSVITYKTECWRDNEALTYLAKVKVVCAVRFEKNLAGGWDRNVLGGVVVPKDKYSEGYFRCQCSHNVIVICCPGGYCDKNLGVMKTVLCGMRHQFRDVQKNNLMADILRDQFEEALYIEEVHGGWDDITFLHGQDQYGSDYLSNPRKEVDLPPIFHQYTM
ncbi:hypothetical protein PRIPAC_84781 [Pristionchus pacificus]|uniref:Uncharacterized protein n=1 Tax=Pristionchus pacificus TaxID=54126 RepID=A0A2A6CIV2_PRIPA|nr:hypothetical protein PRIPAC_84781 [Pristionchus pacificus]|eukprot:PDM77983.1 hypothetical protein PRIPAC_35172 [Pristionchus pacificus]